ncbi:NO-inducible flavohemoprotein [Pontibacillus yanchengensis]|uniref:NO-inducible flavohemoprotein n=1 Tax=Pontibacillus yanchengensis TaxID=462910 RepID=A0ACC7VHP0_9BACI|nr:NO-inducible flavohemoprotein [Pontibacillus yanchengensis]MYL54217.1 NO-inducible flavohemoprotein [Pontibacillus yanchengensis]
MSTQTANQLDQRTIDIVKSTVPVLAEHGEAITKRFYQLLFENHPELKHVFNQANQKMDKQPKALANAVYAAAQYIDQLEVILPAVKQIAHKHRSLNIKPEQYPIVGENLLAAIKDVLGDAATDDIIEAWGKAYTVIADVFIQVEQDMYQEVAHKNGGWLDYRDFKITHKIQESDVITSFYLSPVDQGTLPDYKAGQYITIKVNIPGSDYTQLRQYSLSDAPGKPYFRISVKREDEQNDKPAGVVSNYLHHSINVGDTLPISAPAGDFTLQESDQPLVLISGGVGLTPLVSMLHDSLQKQPDRPVYFIHAAQNGSVHAMKEHLTNLQEEYVNAQVYTCYSNPTVEDQQTNYHQLEGFVNLPWLQSILPSNEAAFYFCGPEGFMKNVNQMLTEWQVSPESINYEFFGPQGSLEVS